MRGGAIILCFSLLCSLARAEHELASPTFVRDSGVAMRITNYYETLPPAGFLPLRVEVQNGSGAPGKWEFRTSHGQGMGRNFEFVTSLAVPAQSQRVFDLLIPLAPQSSHSGRYSNLAISVSGPAVERGSSTEHSAGGKPPTAFLGLGEALAVKHWGALKEHIEKSTKSLDGTPLDPTLLPTDWRALAGFQIIIFSEEEWRKIPAAQQGALKDWVAQGGHLIFWHEGSAPEDLPAARSYGTGRMSLWSADEDFIDRVNKEIVGPGTSDADRAQGDYSWNWKLAEAVGRAQPPHALILLFVLGFAIVIGPVNFLVFAPAGHRHRLFWTTPLISVLATGLVTGLIIGGEGIGGKGERLEALLSLPSEHKAVLWQEQASRTGVLTSSAFTPSDATLLLPINLHGSSGHSFVQGGKYLLDGNVWSGDWFRSRTTQAQVLLSIFPTRGRLELLAANEGGTPQVVSTFEQTLDHVFYYDTTNGSLWHAVKIAPGQKTMLQPAEEQEYLQWKKEVLAPAGAIIRARFENFEARNRRGKFFSSTTMAHPISTLPAVRWKPAGALIFGEVFQP